MQTGNTIALLGKMGHNCWRNQICPDFISRNEPFYLEVGRHVLQYVGPFYNPCHGHDFGNATAHEMRAWVRSNAMQAIRQADYIFTYIDDATCYGTLLELGVCEAMGKTFGVAFASEQLATELWFADPAPIIAESGRTALENWLNKMEDGK